MEEITNEFIKAIRSNNLVNAKKQVLKGADIHARNESAIKYAAANGHLEIVKYLIEQGADIHAENDWAIRYAAEYGHFEVVKFLVEQGADIHAEKGWAIQIASRNDYIEIVKFLVDKGADINSDSDLTLKYATSMSRIEIIKYFVVDLDMKISENTLNLIKKFDTEGSRYALQLIETRELAKQLESSLSVKKEQPQRRMKI